MANKIKLTNARLSFPAIFNKSNFNGEEGKFEATFLLNKETQKDQISMLQKAITKEADENELNVNENKICLKDGDSVSYDGYSGHMAIKATSNKRPTIINRDKTQLAEEDNVVYAGCYVNAVIALWPQNNKFGQRVNANLFGIQFAKDGDAFGVDMDVTDEFDEIASEDDLFE